ncbi:MAG: anthranilate synthase component I family protein [Bacteroidetes bacterium]|nr:anthranilate synthase component I family protein [Bacteroidota bacterium]
MNNKLKEYILSISCVVEQFIFLDSNYIESAMRYDTYEWMVGWGVKSIYKGMAIEELSKFQQESRKWLMGYITYDVKNKIEDLSSKNIDHIGAEELMFFEPEFLIYSIKGQIYYNDQPMEEEALYTLLLGLYGSIGRDSMEQSQLPKLKSRISNEEYSKCFDSIMQHIVDGDIYELNFCIEFYIEQMQVSPQQVWVNLIGISPTPYSTFIRDKDIYMMGASPERYLKKEGIKLIAQPIKGTAKRSDNGEEDKRLKNDLQNSEKERSENVMIVDLMRNDLAKISETGSVCVEELFGIYSFNTVHQMISTISSVAKKEMNVFDVIKGTFPMGSMTGCPKISAMQLIEKYEQTKRGLYSGAVGYISPNGDFDFNVVIRSMLYSSTSKYLSFQVGSAITYKSNPEDEYQECLLKAETMKKALGIA